MKKIAIVSSILENPEQVQKEFNEIVSSFKGIVKGRLGLPMEEEAVAIVSIAVVGTMDQINAFTGKLGQLPNVTVKTAISKKDIHTILDQKVT